MRHLKDCPNGSVEASYSSFLGMARESHPWALGAILSFIERDEEELSSSPLAGG